MRMAANEGGDAHTVQRQHSNNILYVTPNLQKKHLNFVLRLHFRYPDWHDRGTFFDALVVSDSDTQLGNDNI